MTFKRRLTAMSLGLMLVASISPGVALAQEDVDTFAAEDVEWQLELLAVDGVLTDVPVDVAVTLSLSGGEATGDAVCNSYFGAYEIDETNLTFPVPFATTLAFCEGPEQAIEDAYLPLLEMTAGWSVDDDGKLALTDADGIAMLVYGEVAVEITATDLDLLAVALSDLQSQIDEAEAEITDLNEQAESINVNRLRDRIKANEEAIAAINKTIDNLRERIKANEEAIVEINQTIDKFRDRVKALEATAEDHENRISALEANVPVPAPVEE